jgi:peptidylamidoglycolate lyase
MRRAAGGGLVLLSMIALVLASGGAPAGQTPGGAGAPAVAGTPGGAPNAPGVDMNGPYDPVPNWYKPIHPGTLQCGSGVAAESPNRVYVVTEVEVPAGHNAACTPERYKPGAHSHNIIVLDENGNVTEDWKQWDNLFGYGHAIRLNPYDPAHLWIVTRDVQQVHEFTRDGKQLVMTLGWELRHPGNDERHFNMPSDIAFLPDGSFFVSDGYENSRIVKFDKNGKYQFAWGTFGSGPGEFKVPHGVAVDGQRRVYVADRDNARIQIFDEHGHYITEWRNIHGVAHVLATKDGAVWVMTLQSRRMLKFDLTGKLLTSWGVDNAPPGNFAGGHQFSVDPAGNLYVANYRQGVLKFVPKPGADKSRLIGQPY